MPTLGRATTSSHASFIFVLKDGRRPHVLHSTTVTTITRRRGRRGRRASSTDANIITKRMS
jgi:hypothetical protein